LGRVSFGKGRGGVGGAKIKIHVIASNVMRLGSSLFQTKIARFAVLFSATWTNKIFQAGSSII